MLGVGLRNYETKEVFCRCGCGLAPTNNILVSAQAFILILERRMGNHVRHLVTSCARCKKHNADEGGAKASRHLPISGGPDAIDGIFEELKAGRWVQIPNQVVAALAAESGLFGYIAYKRYIPEGKNLVHLDCRPGWPAVVE